LTFSLFIHYSFVFICFYIADNINYIRLGSSVLFKSESSAAPLVRLTKPRSLPDALHRHEQMEAKKDHGSAMNAMKLTSQSFHELKN